MLNRKGRVMFSTYSNSPVGRMDPNETLTLLQLLCWVQIERAAPPREKRKDDQMSMSADELLRRSRTNRTLDRQFST